MPGFSYSVRVAPQSVDVFVGPLAEAPAEPAFSSACLVVEDAVVAGHGPRLRDYVARIAATVVPPIVLPGGEDVKSLDAAARLWSELGGRGVDRHGVIVCAGGGALLDLCGFVAATHLRGVAFVAAPTTLLAQVDAGLGGKCGLNLDGVKNQIGLVRQPHAVVADPAMLETLPERSYRSGLGELAKTALLAGGGLHAHVLGNAKALLAREARALEAAILGTLRFKAAVVERDPFDRGERMILNAGHTIGHVLESEAIRRGVQLEHGEAITIGLRLEASVADDSDEDAIAAILDAFALPRVAPFAVAPDVAAALLARDKKARGGEVAVPVITRPGTVVLRGVRLSELMRLMA